MNDRQSLRARNLDAIDEHHLGEPALDSEMLDDVDYAGTLGEFEGGRAAQFTRQTIAQAGKETNLDLQPQRVTSTA